MLNIIQLAPKEQSSPWNSSYAWDGQETQKDYYRLHKNPVCVPILNKTYSLHSSPMYFSWNYFNVVFPSRLISQLLQPYPVCISLHCHACQPYQLCNPPHWMYQYYVQISINVKLLIIYVSPARSELPLLLVQMFLSAHCSQTISASNDVLETLREKLNFVLIWVTVIY